MPADSSEKLMDILIKNGRIVDPGRNVDEKGHVVISNGKIKDCGKDVKPPPETPDIRIVDAEGKLVLPGLIDIHTHLREPGQEYKEDIASGSSAAAAGGFTTICCMPNTEPANDCGAVTRLILEKAERAGLCRVLPVGAMTKGRKGESLAEIGEMVECGCVAVSDDGDGVADGGLMRRVLEYAKTFGVPAIQHCEDKRLSHRAPMHEGIMSTRAGLAAQPSCAETSMLYRDLELVRLTGARYHAAHISCAESVELIRRAKAMGLPVTAEVTIHHLTFTDELCMDYDTNTKINPPLRTKEDREALRKGFADGTIDALVTDHAPHTSIEKALEYDYAAFGIMGLETAVPLGLSLVEQGVVELKRLVQAWTSGPAKILGLQAGSLAPGSLGDVVVIDPAKTWIIKSDELRSKSSNTPLLGKEVKGRVETTIFGGTFSHPVAK